MVSDVQSVILEIFEAVRKICEEEHITYFAIGGTAIGAVRHHGFIPWDDDLDIAIPVEQYSHFLNAMEQMLPDEFELVYQENRRHYNCLFAKVCKINSTFIETYAIGIPERYTGVWIDVMPIGGVPLGKLSRSVFANRIALLESLNHKLTLPYQNATSIRGKILYFLVTPLRLTNPLFAARRWMKLLERRPFASADLVGYTWCHQVREWYFPKRWFEDTTDCRFEDTWIKIPDHFDEYLTAQFGEYMALPSEGERVSHDGLIDLEHSYKEYSLGIRAISE